VQIIDLFTERIVRDLCEIVGFVFVLFASFMLGLGKASLAEVVVGTSEAFPARSLDVDCLAK
jgi:hypothetical protein